MWWLLFLLCQVDVKTVTKNQELPVEVYGDRNQLTQTLDPGTTIVRTVEDSKASQQFPFLPSPFEFKYDGNERLTQVLFNGLPLYQFTYDGLLLESITVPGQGQGSSKRMKAPETISHDYDGEYRLSGLHSSTRGDLGQVSFSDDGRDRVERYTDPNGVTAQYAYTPEGWVQSIEIGDGPSFHYDYDAQGNLTGVEVDGLAASFNDYQDRVPETMDWLSDGDVLRTFSLTRTPEGKLDRIESNDGAYLLDLDWQQETPSDYPMVVRVERAGPGFGEVIVPRYVTVTTYVSSRR